MEELSSPSDLTLQTEFWNGWNKAHREQLPPGPLVLGRAHCLIEMIKGLAIKDARILEIGCGSGWMCGLLSQFGHVTGIDLADQVIVNARKSYPNVRFIVGDALTTDVRGSFDIVVGLEVLSHVYDQRALVQRVAGNLRAGGFLLLTTQNRFVYERRHDVQPLQPGQIRRWLNRSELRYLLRPHFEVVELKTSDPTGHRGVLRLVNSAKVCSAANHIGLGDAYTRARERLGLGESIIVRARKLN